jgi:hypothetical protein
MKDSANGGSLSCQAIGAIDWKLATGAAFEFDLNAFRFFAARLQ